jgi:excisionase family DNA binding protein
MPDQPLTVAQFADRLQIHKITVQRWLRVGTLKGTKLPGKAGWRIPVSEVERIERGEPSSVE